MSVSDDDARAHPLQRCLALLHHGERIGALGSWESAGAGELLWSENLFRLFGLQPGSPIPTAERVLEMVHPDDRHVAGEMFSPMSREEPHQPIEYRIIRPDGEQRTLRSVITVVVRGDADEPRRLRGTIHDVTEQRSMDRQLAAHAAVTYALASWTSLEQGAQNLLSRLATAMGFEFGVFWVPDGEARLAARSIWRISSPELEPVVETTRRWQPGPNAATVGRAFSARQPVVSTRAYEGATPERSRAIRSAGLECALAVPAAAGDETFAVFEFLSSERIERTDRLMRALDGIGREIGSFLRHRRGELSAPLLSARELEVLQLAAQGRAATEIATVMNLSPATIKRHFERSYAALEVSDRAAAVGEAMRRGLIT